MKKILYGLALICGLSYGQSVKHSNRYGASVVFENGLVLKSKDRYGPSLYFIDGQTIRSKNRYSSLDTISKTSLLCFPKRFLKNL
jgi:hypothetical protein